MQKKYEKWYPKNTTISLIPIGKVTGITTKNLFYPLNNEELIIGYRTGSSNHVAEDGIVTIRTSRRRFTFDGMLGLNKVLSKKF